MSDTLSKSKCEWKEMKLGEIAEVIGGGTPKTSVPKYWGGDIPWLTPRDLTSYYRVMISRGERSITEEGLKNSSARLLPKNTVLLTSRAPIGYVAIAENEICTNQGFKSLIPKKEISDSFFLYYWLKCNTDYLQANGTGTTFSEISGSVVKQLEILLPPLEEQRAIASVLSSLDDKIDLLHRQNQTLEQMAETLFRQWFVEEFDNAKYVKLGKLVDTVDNRGKTPPWTEEKTEYPLIEVNALGNRLVDYSKIKKYVDEETYENWFRAHPKKYDTLFSTVGSIGEFSMFIEELGSIAQNVVAFQAKGISPFYLYQTLKFFSRDIKEFDIGTVQPSIKVSHLREYEIPICTNSEDLKKFDKISLDICSKLEANQTQIRTLTALRDTLLPKLMSGEIRVKLPNTTNG